MALRRLAQPSEPQRCNARRWGGGQHGRSLGRVAPAGAALRHGFTLLEVLIAMFIIMFGLLGIAALLPIASQDMSRAAQADRAGACGRSAMAEMRIRGFCDPMGWLAVQSPGPPPVFGPVVQLVAPGLPALDARESYAIDPLYLAYHADKPGAAQFPFNPDPNNPAAPLIWPAPVNAPWTMQRITLGRAGPAMTAQQAVFDRVFVWQDDVVFGRPADQNRRTAPVFAGPPGTPEYLSYEGRFSWLATVCPAAAQEAIINNTFVLPAPRKQAFRVSVVVFDRRPFEAPGPSADPNEPPAERWADVVAFPGGGTGGGDVVLETSDPAWLALRQGHWLMLAGLEPVPSPPAPQPYYRKVYRWYRILAAGDVYTDPNTNKPRRDVTLAGPDWMMAWNVNGQAKAALFNGAVGVYTEIIEVER